MSEPKEEVTPTPLWARVVKLEVQVSELTAQVAQVNKKLTLGLLVLGALVTGRELPWVGLVKALGLGQ